MREIASKLDNRALIDGYTNAVINLEREIQENKFFNEHGKKDEEIDSEISSIEKDKLAGFYAELLHRLGYDESYICEILKNHRILNYKNGEERYFVKENFKSKEEDNNYKKREKEELIEKMQGIETTAVQLAIDISKLTSKEKNINEEVIVKKIGETIGFAWCLHNVSKDWNPNYEKYTWTKEIEFLNDAKKNLSQLTYWLEVLIKQNRLEEEAKDLLKRTYLLLHGTKELKNFLNHLELEIGRYRQIPVIMV